MNPIRPLISKIQQRSSAVVARRVLNQTRCVSSVAVQDPSSRFSTPSSSGGGRQEANFHTSSYEEAAHAVPDLVKDRFDPRNYGYRVVAVPSMDFPTSMPTAENTAAATTACEGEDFEECSSMSWSRSSAIETTLIFDGGAETEHPQMMYEQLEVPPVGRHYPEDHGAGYE